MVVSKVLASKSATFGYDAANDTYCDMMEAGIVDPVKVTRSALQNAVSVSGLLLTTGCMIADIPEKTEGPAGPPGGMGGMGGMGGGMPGMGGMGGMGMGM